MNWVQIMPNLNDYHSELLEISNTLWLPDITDRWCQQEDLDSKYTDLSNVAHDISSILPHDVRVKARFSLGRDVIGWRMSKTACETLREKVHLSQFAEVNPGILGGNDPALNTTNTENDLEMKKVAGGRKLHRMANVYNFLEMSQESQNLHAAQNKFRTQNKQMTAVEFISDTEVIITTFWSHVQHDGTAAFKLSERSPLPPTLSSNDLPGGFTQILNLRRIRRINCYPVKSG